MTKVNLQGEAVVNFLIDDNLVSTRPQACDSYTRLPDDNSTLSEDCNKVGWNGTHADGKWLHFRASGRYRIWQALRRDVDGHVFRSSHDRRICDDTGINEASLSPGDTWALFVR